MKTANVIADFVNAAGISPTLQSTPPCSPPHRSQRRRTTMAEREAMTLEQVRDSLRIGATFRTGEDREALEAMANAIDAHLSRAAEPVVWMPVCGYEEYYEVSNAGDIRSRKSGRILGKPIMGAGYQKASLWKDG